MEVPRNGVSVDLRRVLFEIAFAIDEMGVEDSYHGQRVAYIAYSCAQSLGWGEERCQTAFYLGLIHDCGVSESAEIEHLLTTFAPNHTRQHCLKGYELLKACRPLSGLAMPIFLHHTWWQELKERNDIDEETKQHASLLFLSDRLDYLNGCYPTDAYGNVTESTKANIVSELNANSDSMFEPSQVQAMSELILIDDFWFSMEARYIEDISKRFNLLNQNPLGLVDSIEVAELFVRIVDAKSTFTYQHSLRVAQLAEFLANKLGYSERTQKMLYLAGLVHDIGKLKTPSTLLYKRNELTDEEYCCIKRHATESRHAIERMFTNRQIAEWASNHHERMDGSGYPQGLKATQLDQPSRLIAIADLFQALVQSRPYRHGLSSEEALTMIEHMVNYGLLDAEVFACLVEHAKQSYSISMGQTVSKAAQV